jgi:hypothetical protein
MGCEKWKAVKKIKMRLLAEIKLLEQRGADFLHVLRTTLAFPGSVLLDMKK